MGAEKQTKTFSPLERSCKNAFPFSLACPSFVYPAGYVDNVRHLAPFVDEIELLFFESRFPDSLPSHALVRELVRLARSGSITYNVHLPTDIYLGHRDAGVRRVAVDVLAQMIDRCAPLSPTTFTLHLIRDPSEPDVQRWQTNSAKSLEAVLAAGLPGQRISLETLDYNFELAAPVIAQLDLSVCMDMGHLMVRGVDITAFYDKWKERITIAHLHGVDGTCDHLALDRLPAAHMNTVMEIVRRFSGVVSLEVFSLPALNASMAHLSRQWRR
ncbi:MAG: TIM barrel protein [Desulfosarcina sp.]|nr:TIM barrel protein [Desulfosarcina sp.]MBC2743910.1 TIM barrel protein [Desulfosarcina sp.]MBC2766819.1 TIM barrel protein [Desulfosarcina sp.]